MCHHFCCSLVKGNKYEYKCTEYKRIFVTLRPINTYANIFQVKLAKKRYLAQNMRPIFMTEFINLEPQESDPFGSSSNPFANSLPTRSPTKLGQMPTREE